MMFRKPRHLLTRFAATTALVLSIVCLCVTSAATQPIRNSLTKYLPLDAAICHSDGTVIGNASGLKTCWEYPGGGLSSPGVWIRAGAIGEGSGDGYGLLEIGGFECIRSGPYVVSMQCLLGGLMGVWVPRPADGWGGAEAHVDVRLYSQIYDETAGSVVVTDDREVYRRDSTHTTEAPARLLNQPVLVTLSANLIAGHTYSAHAKIHFTASVGATGFFTDHRAEAVAWFGAGIVTYQDVDYLVSGKFTMTAMTFADPFPDYIAPTTSANWPEGSYCGSINVTLSATDAGGYGVDTIYTSLDGGPVQTYTGPIPITSSTTLSYYATDHAGNQEIWRSRSYSIFYNAPAAPVVAATPSCTTIGLNWPAVPGAEDYRVLRDEVEMGIVTELTWTDEGPGDQTHCYEVIARNACGTGVASAVICSEAIGPPPAPALVAIADQSSDVWQPVELEWDAIAGATSYRIQLDDEPSFASPELNQETSETSTTASGLAVSQTFWWRVQGQSACGWGEWSEVWSFTTDITTAVGPDATPTRFAVWPNYPNPFNPRTTIPVDLPERAYLTVDVFNVAGERIRSLAAAEYTAGRHLITWDGKDVKSRDVAAGTYFCMVAAGDLQARQKLVLVR